MRMHEEMGGGEKGEDPDIPTLAKPSLLVLSLTLTLRNHYVTQSNPDSKGQMPCFLSRVDPRFSHVSICREVSITKSESDHEREKEVWGCRGMGLEYV